MTDDAQEFSWDAAKSADCLKRRGFGFDFSARLFDGPVLERTDSRRDYGEVRVQAMGRIEGGGLFVVVYVQRSTTKHIVSARRAHEKEVWKWQR